MRGVLVVLTAGLVLPFALVHLDDADGVVYAVVARNLASDGQLFNLRFLPDVFPRFREHPPFFFWFWAALWKAGPERLLAFAGAAFGLLTVVSAHSLARPLLGRRAAFLGCVALATTESFFRYQARPRLDPPLTWAFTASVAALVLARGRRGWLLAGGAAAAFGLLVKGPPALGAPVAAALALAVLGRGAEVRRPGWWALALGPALSAGSLFLLYDHLALHGTWWIGYVKGQVLPSALGTRRDGATDHLYLFRSALTRLGPWSALLLFAAIRSVRRPRSRRSRAVLALLLWALLVLGGYAVAGRSWWHYAMPAYVPLALAAGCGLESLLRRAGPRGFRVAALVTAGAALVLVFALPFRLARFVVTPCILGQLPILTEPPPAGTRVALVAHRVPLAEAGILADHARLEAVPLPSTTALGDRRDIGFALVEGPTPAVPGWRTVGRQGAWTELRRVAPP